MQSLNCSEPPSSSVLSETRREHRCGSEKENLIGVAGSVLLLQGFGGVLFFFEQQGRGNVRAATQLRLWLA